MIHRILLGYDGSESAAAALDMAVEFVRKFSAELHIVAVVRQPEFGDDVETEAVLDHSRGYYQKLLHSLEPRLAQQAIVPVTEVVVGHPAEQLIRYAESHGIDHIIVGHRGHTVFERWLIGSVARQVIA